MQRPNGGASGLGALGFLAAHAGARDWSRLVLVSNRHVLMAHGAAAGDAVYLPSYRASEGKLMFDRDPRPIATIEEGGFEGNYRYAYPDEPERSYFVDCAAAALIDCRDVRSQRGRILFASVNRANPLDALQGREIRVYKLGRDQGMTGKLVSTNATVSLADGTCRDNNLVIRALPGPPFAEEGDSGALILDRMHRAIGLLWGVNLTDPREAYASHIHPVLHCLKLEPFRYELRARGDPAKETRRG